MYFLSPPLWGEAGREPLFDILHSIEVFLIVEPSASRKLVVALADAQADLLPSDAVHLLDALLCQVVVQGVVLADAVDGIGHSIDVPVIDLDDIGENLAAAALLADDGGTAALHGLEGCNAKRLADGRHHEDIAVLVALIDLFPALEAREVTAVGNAVAGSQLYHRVHHRMCLPNHLLQ